MSRYPNAVAISAHTGQGIDRLTAAVSQTLSHNFLDLDVETGVENGRLLARLSAYGEVLSKRFTDTRVVVHCRIPRRTLAHLYGGDVSIRQHGNGAGGVPSDGQPSGGTDSGGLASSGSGHAA
jgi:GTP-binding protein HflX